MYSKLIYSVACLLALSACAVTSKEGVTKAGKVSSGPFGMVTADDIKVDTADAFKDAQKVTIGSFTIGYATYQTASAKAGGGLMGGGFGGRSKAKNELTGINDATMQKITDEAYKNFTSDLKAKGYTVVDRSELLAHKDFKDTKSYENPYNDDAGGFFGDKSVIKYFAPTGYKDIKVFAGDIPGVSGGFAFGNPAMGAALYAKETGVKVLHVVYLLDFANADAYGSSWTSTSSVSVGQGLTVVPGVSKIGIIGGEGGTFSSAIGTISLGQPITSEKEFAKVEGTTSDAYKALEVATNIVGTLGGVGSNSSREFEFKARPADYKAAAMDAFKQANTAMVTKMSSLK